MTHPKTGVTVIITRSADGTWFADAYGPKGAALDHQPQVTYPSVDAAAHAARQLYKGRLVRGQDVVSRAWLWGGGMSTPAEALDALMGVIDEAYHQGVHDAFESMARTLPEPYATVLEDARKAIAVGFGIESTRDDA